MNTDAFKTVAITDSSAFTIVAVEQGTPEWLEWRRHGLGASDAPTIMGENPWKRPSELLAEKCRERESKSNEAMAIGSALEPEARSRFELKIGVPMAPACMQSRNVEWLRASVDGIAADASRVVEIKCGESVYRKTSQSRQVPRYYFGQLQHILAVTNLNEIDFWCYWPNRPELNLVVQRDEEYIGRLLKAEFSFWSQVVERRSEKGGAE